MLGVIDVGGGLRGIYAAGVFDKCFDDNVSFDYCMGVSAGSANLINFLSKQRGRSYRFFHNYSLRKEYMGMSNLYKHNQYIDLDYVYGTLSQSGGEDPLDFETFAKNKSIYTVVVTDAQTGEPAYFTKKDIPKDDYNILKASSALPFVCKGYEIQGKVYYDGGVADPIPMQRALDDGCDKIVLVLTRPVDKFDTTMRDRNIARFMENKYPEIAKKLVDKTIAYKKGLDIALELEKQGKCLIIAPDDCCGVSTLTRNPQKLQLLYDKGYEDGGRIKGFAG